jgi:hypothetical protein
MAFTAQVATASLVSTTAVQRFDFLKNIEDFIIIFL